MLAVSLLWSGGGRVVRSCRFLGGGGASRSSHLQDAFITRRCRGASCRERPGMMPAGGVPERGVRLRRWWRTGFLARSSRAWPAPAPVSPAVTASTVTCGQAALGGDGGVTVVGLVWALAGWVDQVGPPAVSAQLDLACDPRSFANAPSLLLLCPSIFISSTSLPTCRAASPNRAPRPATKLRQPARHSRHAPMH